MLEKFNTQDKLLASIATTAIGDCFAELQQPKEAIEYYKKAMTINKNTLTTPIVLMKCAKIYESEKNYSQAIKCYNEINTNYPESKSATKIEEYINRISKK